MRVKEKKSRAPFYFLGGFFSIFLFAGLGVVTKSYFSGSFWTESLGVAIPFVAVGLLGVFAAFKLLQNEKLVEQLKEKYPEMPWMWNKYWAKGVGEESTTVGYAIILIIGFVFICISIPILWDIGHKILKTPLSKEAAVLVFPLFGAGMLISGFTAYLRARKFNDLTCYLEALPGVLGEKYQLRFSSSFRFPPQCLAKVILQQLHTYTTGTGDNKNTHTDIEWEAYQDIPFEGRGRFYEGVANFTLPTDIQPTQESDNSKSYYWVTRLHIDIPGLDAIKEFKVPVFKIEGRGLEGKSASLLKRAELTEEGKISQPLQWKEIRKQPSPTGETVYQNIRGINWTSFFVGLFLSFLFIGLGSFVYWVINAKFIEEEGQVLGSLVPLVFVVVGVIFMFITLVGKLVKRKIVISGDTAQINSWFGDPTVINLSEVNILDLKTNTRVNGRTTAWDIVIVASTSVRPLTVLGPIYNEAEAHSVIEDLKNYLDLAEDK